MRNMGRKQNMLYRKSLGSMEFIEEVGRERERAKDKQREGAEREMLFRRTVGRDWELPGLLLKGSLHLGPWAGQVSA